MPLVSWRHWKKNQTENWVILKLTPPYFLRIYVHFRRFIELPPQTVRFSVSFGAVVDKISDFWSTHW